MGRSMKRRARLFPCAVATVAVIGACTGLVRDAAAAFGTKASWSPRFPGNLGAPVHAPAEVAEAANIAAPCVRYGAAGGVVTGAEAGRLLKDDVRDADQLVITHGYLYRHDVKEGAFLQDTWVLDLSAPAPGADGATKENRARWRRLRTDGNTPPAMYKMAYASVPRSHEHPGGQLVMHGGDDGGGPQAATHVWGSYHGSVYALDVARASWRLVAATSQSGSAMPPPLAGHSALMNGNNFVVAFGVTAPRRSTVDASQLQHTNDVWSLELRGDHGAWRQAFDGNWNSPDEPTSGPPPRRQSSFTLIPPAGRPGEQRGAGRYAVAYGGYGASPHPANMEDVWVFDLNKDLWYRVATNVAGDRQKFIGRGGHGAAFIDGTTLAIVGGANCVPGCTCLPDVLLLFLDQQGTDWHGMWTSVSPSGNDDSPWPIPRHTMAATGFTLNSRSGLLMFGGESYSPYAYWNDLWELRAEAPGQGALQEDDSGRSDRRLPVTRQDATGEGWGTWPFDYNKVEDYPRDLMVPRSQQQWQKKNGGGGAKGGADGGEGDDGGAGGRPAASDGGSSGDEQVAVEQPAGASSAGGGGSGHTQHLLFSATVVGSIGMTLALGAAVVLLLRRRRSGGGGGSGLRRASSFASGGGGSGSGSRRPATTYPTSDPLDSSIPLGAASPTTPPHSGGWHGTSAGVGATPSLTGMHGLTSPRTATRHAHPTAGMTTAARYPSNDLFA